MPRTHLNIDVLSRFMTAQQLAELEKGYQENLKTPGTSDRFTTLQVPPTDKELAIFRDYLYTPSMTIADIAQKYQINSWDVRKIALNTCARLRYQGK